MLWTSLVYSEFHALSVGFPHLSCLPQLETPSVSVPPLRSVQSKAGPPLWSSSTHRCGLCSPCGRERIGWFPASIRTVELLDYLPISRTEANWETMVLAEPGHPKHLFPLRALETMS